jgi:hypothetical protein
MTSQNEEVQATAEETAAANVIGLLQAGQMFYNEKPTPDEVNLVAKVRDWLKEKAVDEELLVAAFDKSNFVQEAEGKHAHAQLFNLNRWMDEQLSIIQAEDNIDTRLFRYQVMYEVSPDQWLTVVEKGVLPNLVEFGLRKRG